jgi:hypothetical protein
MPYPALRPTSRSFDPGNWPIRTYNAQSGVEIRLLYGSKRYNLRLELTYANIPDSSATQFLAHFDETTGTFSTFELGASALTAIYDGWRASTSALSPPAGVNWRYESAPRVENVRPGISTVTVSLIGVI